MTNMTLMTQLELDHQTVLEALARLFQDSLDLHLKPKYELWLGVEHGQGMISVVSMNLDPRQAEPWNEEAWLSLSSATNNNTTTV